MPTIPATWVVPDRRPSSCPPPGNSARSGVPDRTTSAPTPLGPPNLCADTDTSAAGVATRRRSSHAAACTASVCSTAPGACSATTAATSARSLSVPISLLAAMTDTRPTFPGDDSSAASASRSIRPSRCTATVDPPRAVTVASTAGCSTAEHTTRSARVGIPPVTGNT